MVLQLAWKNIWRNRARSLLVIGSVILGLWVGAFLMAYSFGAIDQRMQDAVAHEVSHFQVHHPEFERDNEAVYSLESGTKFLADLHRHKLIKAATGRVITFGVIASANSSTGAKFIGILPEHEDAVTSLKAKIDTGRYFTADDNNKTIIGQKLADKLGVKLRSKIVLTFQDVEGNIASGAYRIVGIYKMYNSSIEEMNVYVKAPDLAAQLETPEHYHEIAALLYDADSLDMMVQNLKTKYPDDQIEDWRELAPELGLMVESFDQYMVIFLIIILLAISFGIINTMLMAVLERIREIGMLMAIGMNKWRIFSMISLETILLIMIASPIGLLLAYLTINYLGRVGMDLSSAQDSYASFGFQSFIYPSLDPNYYWQILVMVAVAAFAASIYPAFTAIRLDPVQAMRKI